MGDNRIYMFPKIGIGHTRLCNFWLQKYDFFLSYASILAEITKHGVIFLRFMIDSQSEGTEERGDGGEVVVELGEDGAVSGE